MSEIHDAAPPRKGESSAKRAERIEAACSAARAVAATPGARELSARPAMPGDKLARGTWTPEDERRLRERGEIVMPDGRVYRIKGDT